MDSEIARGLLVISNDGTEFAFEGRRFLTDSSESERPRAVLIPLSPERASGLAESASVALDGKEQIRVRLGTLSELDQIDVTSAYESIELGPPASTPPKSRSPLRVLRQGGVCVIIESADHTASYPSAR
ncbi:MAG: hypothetical protein ACF8GE_04055 [Phycisphaerales bacterium JB043]